MKNKYLKYLEKIEFVITYACFGRCKHCSQGEHSLSLERIRCEAAAEALRRIAAEYKIKTVLVFGGEPLLYTDAVFAIISVAKELGIERRQIITNGFFSKDEKQIKALAEQLFGCGVNDLILSVDAFHQETIPLDTVKIFASEAMSCGIPVRLSPAWLVSAEDENPYNRKTREILDSFSDLKIPISEGNIVFPEGNALKYLGEYFEKSRPENPYIQDPCRVKCLSFSPNGEVLDGNFYEKDIMEIIKDYSPN